MNTLITELRATIDGYVEQHNVKKALNDIQDAKAIRDYLDYIEAELEGVA